LLCWRQNYFIGTVLSSLLEQNTHKIYELIDGQQRTTTLMLIAIAFKTAGSKTLLTDVIVYENKPRLQFAIRASPEFIGKSCWTKIL
jgi:uncharacterized protein with ParB-like and HNH nuclease domain